MTDSRSHKKTGSIYEDHPISTPTGYSEENDSSQYPMSGDDAAYDINDAEINLFVSRIGNDIPVSNPRDNEIINQLIGYIKTLQGDKKGLMKLNNILKDEKSEIEEQFWTLKQENYRLVSENQVRKSVLKEQKEDFMHVIRHSFSLPNPIGLSPRDSSNRQATVTPNGSMMNLLAVGPASPLNQVLSESDMKELKSDFEDQRLMSLREAVDTEEQV